MQTLREKIGRMQKNVMGDFNGLNFLVSRFIFGDLMGDADIFRNYEVNPRDKFKF